MSDIKRLSGGARGRSRASIYQDLVFTVATAADAGPDIASQTSATLAQLDRNLADAGSDKTRILSATVYITDMALKTDMDRVWCEWIGEPENWPQRACVQTGLEGATLVEIVLTATRK